MIKDLSKFVSDLSDMKLPAFDQSVSDFISRLKNLFATLKQVSNNYSQSYIANRLYHYDSNQQFQDDTTDAMAAPATAVLENAVSQLKTQWDAIINGRSGTSVDVLLGGTGSKPVVQLPSTFMEVKFSGQVPETLTVDFSALSLPGTMESLFPAWSPTSNCDITLPWKVNGCPILFEFRLYNTSEVGASMYFKILIHLSDNRTFMVQFNPNIKPGDSLASVFNQFSGTHSFRSDGPTSFAIAYTVDGFDGVTKLTSDYGISSVMADAVFGLFSLDWSNYHQNVEKKDLFEIIASVYPNPSPLIEDLESLLL